MPFIDSCVFIAANFEKEAHHQDAKEILRKFKAGGIRELMLTDYIVLETCNYLLRKGSFKKTLDNLNLINIHKRIHVINVDGVLYKRAVELFKNYECLSFGDCSLVAAMEDYDTKSLYSFDSGFDSVAWVERKRG